MMKRYVLISVLLLLVGCSIEQATPIVNKTAKIKTDSAETQESCYLIVNNKTEIDDEVLTNISLALIAQCFKEIKKVPIE